MWEERRGQLAVPSTAPRAPADDLLSLGLTPTQGQGVLTLQAAPSLVVRMACFCRPASLQILPLPSSFFPSRLT